MPGPSTSVRPLPIAAAACAHASAACCASQPPSHASSTCPSVRATAWVPSSVRRCRTARAAPTSVSPPRSGGAASSPRAGSRTSPGRPGCRGPAGPAAQQRHRQQHERQDREGHGDHRDSAAHGADRIVGRRDSRVHRSRRCRRCRRQPRRSGRTAAPPAPDDPPGPTSRRCRVSPRRSRGPRRRRRTAWAPRAATVRGAGLAESALRGARASAALDGADLPLDVVRHAVSADGLLARAGASRGPGRPSGRRGGSATAARRGRCAPLQALARLHVLAAADLLADGDLGRPAPAAAAPVDVTRAAADDPHSGAGPRRGGGRARRAGRPWAPSRWPAGVVARAAATADVGDARAGPDCGLGARRSATSSSAGTPTSQHWRATRRAAPEGIAGWVVHCAHAVVLGAREGVAVCEAIQRGS